MNKYRICVYAICKNEEQFAEAWVKSMSEADKIVVLDTGSEDKTVSKLKNAGADVYEEKIIPWRFDTARNRSLELVPDDIDICVCVDLDERFEPGWREILEKTWKSDTKGYSTDTHGILIRTAQRVLCSGLIKSMPATDSTGSILSMKCWHIQARSRATRFTPREFS